MYNNIQKHVYISLIALFLCTFAAKAQDAAAPADPAATPAAAAAPASGGDAAVGETIFKNNCAACHAVTSEKLVGPGLKGIEERRDFAWLKKWIHNPNGVIASGDDYAVKLYEAYGKAQMTAFPNLTDDEIKGILAYVSAANVPVAAAPAVAGAVATGGESTGGGQFFNVVMIALMVIMALVLVALLAILQLLTKLAGVDTVETTGMSMSERFKTNLKGIAANRTIRSAVIWLFILLATKASLDGLYGLGIHKGYAPEQPIAFSHKLHAGEYEINCTYCHTGVYKGKQAGIPSANICMNCHNAIKRESPEIQKIYTALEKDQPIEWVRVHNLPDLAYFNHAQHTNVGGLDCINCHGEIPKMEVVQQVKSLTMGWCIDCHRETDVNAKGNEYYDNLLKTHEKTLNGESMKVEDIGGLECARCHY